MAPLGHLCRYGPCHFGQQYGRKHHSPFVIGRKNWLFSVTPEGAAASAAIYSLIETAKANGLEPYWYFRYLLEKLPDAMTEDDLQSFVTSIPRQDQTCRSSSYRITSLPIQGGVH
ncbi:transposase domain-containing protein [uncultured Desulfobacter sp.]|uniref:transposase domain-containing protein n=1 Tax=uncultured Desulfobacter sp. TaxID=240139 RepID=UPI002AAB42B9|nr:transposase domain-containing protein [uncultured Desulfobacter sp.]